MLTCAISRLQDRLIELYHEYDEDKNGTLSLSEFKTLMHALCPADEVLDKRRVFRLFKEVTEEPLCDTTRPGFDAWAFAV